MSMKINDHLKILTFFSLPTVLNDERDWRSTLASFKETFSEIDMPMKEFCVSSVLIAIDFIDRCFVLQKVTDAFLAAMQKNAGGVSAEQKKEWEALLNKAYADMKTWGWY